MDTNNKIMSRIEKSPGIPALVASQIIDLIADGRLKPGEKLPSEQEMTQLFGISRISLREAMKLLEAREYIETRGRKGKFIQSMVNTVKTPIEEIISMNYKKIWELLEVRRILDSQAAAIACKNATQKDLERLKNVKDQALDLGPDQILHDIKNGGIIYTSFFDIVAESTGNTIFVHLRKSVN
ncbi:MAG: GntR family transcriptional regulator, partial [Thermodesulfobacteriota bacterium]|nr:GntR family transcriptional regulator [Thermodesulfobacteriota bacterium]